MHASLKFRCYELKLSSLIKNIKNSLAMSFSNVKWGKSQAQVYYYAFRRVAVVMDLSLKCVWFLIWKNDTSGLFSSVNFHAILINSCFYIHFHPKISSSVFLAHVSLCSKVSPLQCFHIVLGSLAFWCLSLCFLGCIHVLVFPGSSKILMMLWHHCY